MSEFAGNEELLRDFVAEAGELLVDIDQRLLALEHEPGIPAIVQAIFRDFHTIKGSAGFLGLSPLVELCHRTENLLERMRSGSVDRTRPTLDCLLDVTAALRKMFDQLANGRQPAPAPPALLAALDAGVTAQPITPHQPATPACMAAMAEPDWHALLASVTGSDPVPRPASPPPGHPRYGRRSTDQPGGANARSGRRAGDPVVLARDSTLPVDTARLDHVLNLSGELGLTKDRLLGLRTALNSGQIDAHSLRALDQLIGGLDRQVSELQDAVMKTRMQPVGRLFQKYPRLVRDLARQLGKEVELRCEGEDTELDRSMLEDLADPLMHLVRNALDHGLEAPWERRAAGKPARGTLVLSARQARDGILIRVADDGRGMQPDALRRKAIATGLMSAAQVQALDDRGALRLILLPGFSTKEQVSSISGRGVGMDVVRTNIEKLNGHIDIVSELGAGTSLSITLPLTMAILPVLVVRLGDQPLALPLDRVREVVRIDAAELQRLRGHDSIVVRDEVLPVRSLAALLRRSGAQPAGAGVLVQVGATRMLLAVDAVVGRDEIMIKPLGSRELHGIRGASLSGQGTIELVPDVEALLRDAPPASRADQPLSIA